MSSIYVLIGLLKFLRNFCFQNSCAFARYCLLSGMWCANISSQFAAFFFQLLNSVFKKNNNFVYLFVFGCAGSSFLLRLSLVAVSHGLLLFNCGLQASYCGGFSCCRAGILECWTLVVAAYGLSTWGSWALEHRLNSGVGLVALWHVESFWITGWTHIFCIGKQMLYHWDTREAQWCVSVE